jgi:hypothetical protein
MAVPVLTESKILCVMIATCVVAVLAFAAPPPRYLVVVCSPGSPGTTEDARPAMDAFAGALGKQAGVPVSAVYDPSEDGGAARLKETGIGIVSLPFFLKHERDLALRPRLQIQQLGRPALEKWSLVARSGVTSFDGYQIASTAAYAPGFVRGVVKLPASVKPIQVTAVLSALKRAASGEQLAVLLDGPQAAALSQLPFASKLAVAATSPPVPTAYVVTIDARVNDKAWAAIAKGFDTVAGAPLEGVQISKFEKVDDAALATAKKLYGGAP